ncbi:hypothetical protein ACWEV3_41015 [Saccharopolyspora sp. NPDC003752]
MALPTRQNGWVVDASADWNPLINQVNTNTAAITDATTTLTGHTTSINSLGTRMTTAEGNITTLQGQARAAAYSGSWTDNNSESGGVTINNASGGGNAGVKITDIGVIVGTAAGCSVNAGTFTPTVAGKWLFNFGVQFVGGSSAMRAIYLAVSTAANTPSGVKYGLNAAVSDAISSSARITLSANQSVSIYAACWTSGGSVQVWRAQGNLLSATWIGP